MAMFEIKMPKLGESITEGTIIGWSVKVGDIVQEDDVLFEVNTAKVSAEIPSPVAGKVTQILFREGDVVPVGTVVALIDLDGESGQEANVPDKQPQATEDAPQPQTEEAPLPEKMPTTATSGRWYSPIVLQLAKEAGISSEELDTIHGTGYEGRLSKKDMKDYLDRRQKNAPQAAPETLAPATKSTQAAATTPTPTTEAGQAAAATLTPTTEAGQAAAATPQQAPARQSAAPLAAGKDDEVREMDYVRRLIADHMVLSKKTSPHVTTVVEADVSRMVQWRAKNKDTFFRREGVKLTYMPLIAAAVSKALADFPMVNSSVDGYNIILKKHINMGIAVSLDDGNLIVPVIHDSDKLNINGLAAAIDSLAAKARAGKLTPTDIDGGTFTITNFGTFRSLFGTPIINQPQVAILGVGFIEKKPAVMETPEGDVIVIRHKMYLSLSYDHRVIDGSLGGMFLKRIADYIENWEGSLNA